MDTYFASHKSLNLLNDDARKIFKNLVEEVDTALFMADEHCKIFYGNLAFRNLWDSETAAHLMGSNWLYLIFSDQRVREQLLSRLREQGDIRELELQVRVQPEQKLTVLFSANIIRDDEGKPIGIRGTLVDITRRSLLEDELRAEHEKLKQILDLCNVSGGFLKDTELAKFIVEQTSAILHASRCSLMCVDALTNEIFIKSAVGISEQIQQSTRVRLGVPVCGLLAQQGKAVLVEDIERNHLVQQKNKPCYGSRSFICAPVIIGQKVVGLLNVSGRSQAFTPLDLKVAETIARQTSVNLDKIQTLSSLETLSHTDGLTSLLNYRSFVQRLKDETGRARRYGRPFCLAMTDIDNFKQYNDSKGHLAGNALLQRLAGILRDTLRGSDIICRYGGDEFAIILPETDAAAALIALEKIRSLVEEEYRASRITLSIGIAQYEAKDNSETLVKNADQALYDSKNSGRNRISVRRVHR